MCMGINSIKDSKYNAGINCFEYFFWKLIDAMSLILTQILWDATRELLYTSMNFYYIGRCGPLGAFIFCTDAHNNVV
jgi:hypothetical protein